MKRLWSHSTFGRTSLNAVEAYYTNYIINHVSQQNKINATKLTLMTILIESLTGCEYNNLCITMSITIFNWCGRWCSMGLIFRTFTNIRHAVFSNLRTCGQPLTWRYHASTRARHYNIIIIIIIARPDQCLSDLIDHNGQRREPAR